MNERRKRVNIRDVARRAGVSPTTVSHALGGQRPVSEATRARVREAVEELGYRPHPGARSLKAQGTGVVALCLVNDSSRSAAANLEYYFRLMQTVTEVAHKEGFALVVVPSIDSHLYWERLLVDGAIISDPITGDPNIAFLRSQGLPYVTVGRNPDTPEEGYWVEDDNTVETHAMLDHLRRRGATDITLLTWALTDYWTQSGIRAYREWCSANGFSPRIELVRGEDENPTVDAARRLLEGPTRPDAIYSLEEIPGIVVLAQARELGIAVPGQLMVAGPGDFGMAPTSTPPMTTLEYDYESQGREAACMLVRLVRGEPIDEPHKTVPFTITERESTRR